MKVEILDVGSKVRWTSQSRGSIKEKKGTVIAVVEAGENPRLFLPRDLSSSQIKFDLTTSNHKRYIVAVPRGGMSEKVDYYCPRVTDLRLLHD